MDFYRLTVFHEIGRRKGQCVRCIESVHIWCKASYINCMNKSSKRSIINYYIMSVDYFDKILNLIWPYVAYQDTF